MYIYIYIYKKEMIESLAILLERYCTELRSDLFCYMIKQKKSSKNLQPSFIALLWYELILKVEYTYYFEQWKRNYLFLYNSNTLHSKENNNNNNNNHNNNTKIIEKYRQNKLNEFQLPLDIIKC